MSEQKSFSTFSGPMSERPSRKSSSAKIQFETPEETSPKRVTIGFTVWPIGREPGSDAWSDEFGWTSKEAREQFVRENPDLFGDDSKNSDSIVGRLRDLAPGVSPSKILESFGEVAGNAVNTTERAMAIGRGAVSSGLNVLSTAKSTSGRIARGIAGSSSRSLATGYSKSRPKG